MGTNIRYKPSLFPRTDLQGCWELSLWSYPEEVGRFLGNFVGGLADGMKERQVVDGVGWPLSLGSIKNVRILNGLAMSSVDQANRFPKGCRT